MKIETTAYIVLEPQRNWQGTVESIKVDRMTQGPPDLKSKQVALKLNVAIDSGIFEQFIPEATITIKDGRTLITPVVSVEEPEADASTMGDTPASEDAS